MPTSSSGDEIQKRLHIARHWVGNALARAARLDGAVHGLPDTPIMPVDPDASNRMSRTARKLVFEKTCLVHCWMDDPANTVRVIGFRHGGRVPRQVEP